MDCFYSEAKASECLFPGTSINTLNGKETTLDTGRGVEFRRVQRYSNLILLGREHGKHSLYAVASTV